MNNVRNLSFIGICMAFVVIALGAWTRLVDAGLGCPDWPGCYGFVFWPNDEAEIALAESRFPMFPYDINKAIPEQVLARAPFVKPPSFITNNPIHLVICPN